jgi:hypothetical protein
MAQKPKTKPPKLTDAERHARFVDMAREVGVDESPEAFDRAFEKVTKGPRAVEKPPS